jgi:parvulin-like peptidyl-prolyl isomerase
VIRTPRRLAVAIGLSILLLSGCAEAVGSPANAATVGDVDISTSQLKGLVERGLSDPAAEEQFGADRAGFQQQALSRLIKVAVMERAAEDEGVEVSEGQVDDQIAQFAEQAGGRKELDKRAAESGVAAEDLPDFVRSLVLEQAIGEHLVRDVEVPDEQLQELYEQNPEYDLVQSRHILVGDEALARKTLAEVQADRSVFEAKAAELSIDPSNKDTGGDLGLAPRGKFVPAFDAAVFGAEPGDVLLVQTEFGWHVVEVLDRQTTTLEEARPELRRGFLAEEAGTRVGALLQKTAKRMGVKVNPRFGTYDLETGAVVAKDDPNDVLEPGEQEGVPDGEAPAPGEEQQPPAEGEQPAPPAEGEAPAPTEPPAAE